MWKIVQLFEKYMLSSSAIKLHLLIPLLEENSPNKPEKYAI